MLVIIKCDPGATFENFNDCVAVETLEYDLYEYDTMDGAFPRSLPEEFEPTPDAAPDHYLNA